MTAFQKCDAGDPWDGVFEVGVIVVRQVQFTGLFYDPGSDGIRCRSLGVYEHWNNGSDKKYWRNLGKAHGIELFEVYSAEHT